MESGEGCKTMTTSKKGEGFVPYNYFNIKWGQVPFMASLERPVMALCILPRPSPYYYSSILLLKLSRKRLEPLRLVM